MVAEAIPGGEMVEEDVVAVAEAVAAVAIEDGNAESNRRLLDSHCLLFFFSSGCVGS